MAALLADKAVDVVCICTPSGYHADVVKQAAEAGKHIVVEKPMAITTEQLDAIVRCCEANGVMLTSIAQSRFSRSVIRTKNAVEEGLLGRIVTADIYMKYFRSQEYYDSGSWRGTKRLDGGGALMNQGIHGVDLLLYLAGPVKRVYARARRSPAKSRWRTRSARSSILPKRRHRRDSGDDLGLSRLSAPAGNQRRARLDCAGGEFDCEVGHLFRQPRGHRRPARRLQLGLHADGPSRSTATRGSLRI